MPCTSKPFGKRVVSPLTGEVATKEPEGLTDRLLP